MDLAFIADHLQTPDGRPAADAGGLGAVDRARRRSSRMGVTWMRASGSKPLELFARGYVFVFRGTPLLVQLFVIYYGLASFPAVRASFLWPLLRDAFFCAVLSLALCTAAYQSEIFRGALAAIPHGQIEAARACGMSGLRLVPPRDLPDRAAPGAAGLFDRGHLA